MKKLILGFATNQTTASVAVFLRSARAVHDADAVDIGLVTNTTDGIADIVRETGCRIFHTVSTYGPRMGRPAKAASRAVIQGLRALQRTGARRRMPEIADGYRHVIEIWHHPHFARWTAIARVLGAHAHEYEAAFLSDVKDVLFQSDVFAHLGDDAVQIFEEAHTFGEQRWNAEWVRKGYGEAAVKRLHDVRPICVGTVMGRTEPLRALCLEFFDIIGRDPFLTVEQGMFNYHYQAGTFTTPLTVIPELEGAVATLAGEVGAATTLLDGTVLRRRSDGRIIPAVHGYDRYDHLRDPMAAPFLRPPAA
ncbi:hypothetical protein [Jannaschia sp. LMIT008]|uniref:hypothetical protein n=1 Tax=Jannaschia maritima TaxID=3032585 RepID=UPI002811082A|nr:hypothetical protein [Jannaschia sp. LMIT008]